MAIEHLVRMSLIVKETTFRLLDDALEREEDGAKTKIPYGDISEVNLISYAGAGGRQGQISLKTKSGKKLKTRSHHYQSLGSFENRSSTYAPFVQGLLHRVAQANPNAKFHIGSNILWFLWLAVFILCVIVGLFLLYIVMSGEALQARMIGGAVVIVAGGAMAWRSLRTNRQETFHPDAPPNEFLQF